MLSSFLPIFSLLLIIGFMFVQTSSVFGAELLLPNQVLRTVPVLFNMQGLEQLENGIWIDERGSQFHAIALVDGEHTTLSVAGDRQSLVDNVSELTKRKLTDLESSYGIRITRDGDAIRTVELDLFGTAPMLSDLVALEYALGRSNPAFLPCHRSKKPLQICFLSIRHHYGALAEWMLDAKGNPVILIEPTRSSTATLESVLLHELSHHSQFRMGLKPDNLANWKLAKRLGWQFFQNPATADQGWEIKCRDGKLFKYGSRVQRWVRCNPQGQPLAKSGDRVKRQLDAETLSNCEIAEKAVVRPATSYFTSPAELMAEGMMLFRLNSKARSFLLAVTPELYDLVKEQDQIELDDAYGQGAMSRAPSGEVKPAGPDTRLSIELFESRTI